MWRLLDVLRLVYSVGSIMGNVSTAEVIRNGRYPRSNGIILLQCVLFVRSQVNALQHLVSFFLGIWTYLMILWAAAMSRNALPWTCKLHLFVLWT